MNVTDTLFCIGFLVAIAGCLAILIGKYTDQSLYLFQVLVTQKRDAMLAEGGDLYSNVLQNQRLAQH